MKPVSLLRLFLLIPALLCFSPVHAQTSVANPAMYVAGKMYVAPISQWEPLVMHIEGSFIAAGNPEIKLEGGIVLTRNFINNISGGNVFTNESSGIFEFRGEHTQYITGNASKTDNYIYFPNLTIKNQTFVQNIEEDIVAVLVASNIGVQTNDINIEQGRLILQSDFDITGRTKTAHLFVEGAVAMPGNNRDLELQQRGLFQVDLQLNPLATNQRRIIGFTPPFHKMYADYFMFNLVSAPNGDSLFGNQQPLLSPKSGMVAGKGYLIGLGVIPIDVYEDQMSPNWYQAEASDRIIDKISLVRDFAPTSLSNFVNNDRSITDKYTGETPNTDDVQIQITEGWNFLGNPYTVPIDLQDIINDGSLADWGINDNDIERSFTLVKDGRGTYTDGSPMNAPESYVFELTTETVTKEAPPAPEPSTIIAPMQMFILKKVTDGTATLTIPASARVHKQANFSRSILSDEYVPENELLLEVKDSESIAYDRIAIAFRPGAVTEARSNEDASKLFNNTRGNSQLYTLSSDGTALVSNILPAEVTEVPLYLRPAIQPREVTFTVSRMESFTVLETLILVDKVTKEEIDLKKNPVYTFTTQPGDREDRFLLRFSGELEPFDDTSGITGYYRDGRMEITGLTETHRNKQLLIYDTQGRAVHQSQVQNVPTETIYVNLHQGVYIVNVAGEKFSLSAN